MSPNAEDACHPQLFFDSSVPQVTVTSKSFKSTAVQHVPHLFPSGAPPHLPVPTDGQLCLAVNSTATWWQAVTQFECQDDRRSSPRCCRRRGLQSWHRCQAPGWPGQPDQWHLFCFVHPQVCLCPLTSNGHRSLWKRYSKPVTIVHNCHHWHQWHHCRYCQFCQYCPHYHHCQERLCFHVTTGGQRKAQASRNHSQLCLTNPEVQGGRNHSHKKLTIAIYDDHKNCGFVRFVFLSAKRCLVKTLSDKEDEFKLSLKVKKEQCNFQGLFVWTVFVFPKTYLKNNILKNKDCICVS